MTNDKQKLLEEYLSDLKVNNMIPGGTKYDIREYYRYTEKEGLDMLNISIREAQEFQEYLLTKTKPGGEPHYKRGSALAILSRVTSYYNYLKKRKLVHANPFKEIHKAKREKHLPRNILNESDMDKLLSKLRDFNKAKNLKYKRQLYKAHIISELMYGTGARINEIANVKLSDIDFERETVRIYDRKTRSTREGILNTYTAKILKLYIEEIRTLVYPELKDKE